MSPLEVIWINDALIRPPGPKMVVCISPERGWFFRINTRGHWRPCVPLLRADNPFPDHDSFIECQIIELDDYIVASAISDRGIIGVVHRAVCNRIRDAIRPARDMPNGDKAIIHEVMQRLAR